VNALRRLPALLRRTVVSGWQHRLLGLSAEAAFWQLLSLPSLFLAALASLGYVSQWFDINADDLDAHIESALGRAFSADVVKQIVSPTLREVLHGQRIDVISIGFVLALWAGSSATATFVNTITIAYGMRDQRGAVRSRLLALWLFLGSVLIGCAVLPMLVLGPTLLTKFIPEDERHTASAIIHDLYYPVVILLILIGLTSLYHLAPPRRLPWHRGVPGALLAMGVFLGGSAGLRWYISFILDHNHAYGTLAAPIAALLFFYVLALGVLLGAEFNAAIEAASPSRIRRPRVLHPKGWQQLDQDGSPDGIDS
jgi:membrane protein